MALVKKIGRMARLAGIIGVSLGSMILAACGGKEKAPGQVPDKTAEPAKDAGLDIEADSKQTRENRRRTTAPDDAGTDPDTDLWNIICE